MEIQVIKVEAKSRRLKHKWTLEEAVDIRIRHDVRRSDRIMDERSANIWKRLFG